jgi:hypothetical protein
LKLVILFGLPVFSFYHLRNNFNRLSGFEDDFGVAYGTLFQSVDPYRTSVY